ncbi:MAG: hypothetical protein AB1437_08215 [Pseudomonadota bacterium]
MNEKSTLQTKLYKDTYTDVPVSSKRKVTYRFIIETTKKLNLPYAVSINGIVLDAFSKKAKKVDTSNGVINVENVEPGQKVSLYLNSDAHPDYRKCSVYSVTPYDHDIEVTIKEKTGKHSYVDVPTKITDSIGTHEGRKIEKYAAFLTGDIWMRISHAYTLAEVEDFLSSETNPTIRTLIKSIYEGISKPSINLTLPGISGTSHTKTITLNFGEPANAKENISNVSNILNECLKRTHPTAYAAAINAALETDASKISITSTWRLMEGSIAHRAGLGLDINLIDSTRLNRQELTKITAVDTENVSQKEKELFKILLDKQGRKGQASQNLAKAQAEIRKSKNNPGAQIVAIQELKKAEEARKIADEELKAAEIAWNDERDKNEPNNIRNFRAALIRSKYVAQIFDPWFMDDNVKDSLTPTANLQITKNESIHSHHLHITVIDPKIL